MGKYFKWDAAGYQALRQSPEVQTLMREYAGSIQRNAMSMSGCNFEFVVKPGKRTTIAQIFAGDSKARVMNLRKNILLKAMP